MKLNEIRDNQGARKSRTRVCRGIGCSKGKTGGRGQKGQKSRTGVSINGFEGGQMPIYRRLPMRGFKNLFKVNYTEVNLGLIQKAIENGQLKEGEKVNAVSLMEAGLISKVRDGVKVLSSGDLSAKIDLFVAAISKAAQEKVEKAGGSVELEVKKCFKGKDKKKEEK
ncbi:MAG: 50S ribosomal protein L15 [Alphaproteobacteria bacterium]|nr:50S ribosomal protein L15 [Alphaproteobacteria bacterium]NCB50009.1 50S ribosomal protein L15 [Alphaproteobacteria bacterium]